MSPFKGISIDKSVGKISNNDKGKGSSKKPKFEKAKSTVIKANQPAQLEPLKDNISLTQTPTKHLIP